MRGIGFIYSLLRPVALVGLGFLVADDLRAGGEAIVNRVSALNGTIEGDVRVLAAETLTLNGGARVDGRLIVSGSPQVRINGGGWIGSRSEDGGSSEPAGWRFTLNGGARIQELVTCGRAVGMPGVTAPPAPVGRRDVVLNRPSDHVADFPSVRHLTLNGAAGEHAIPGGTYGRLTVNGRSVVVLGEHGANRPTRYAFQRFILNGAAEVKVVGPVEITLAEGATVQAKLGNAEHPEWLRLEVARGGVTLNGQARLFGEVILPDGALILNGGSEVVGGVVADRLLLNGGARLRLLTINRNKPPTVRLTSPPPDAQFVAPATVGLVADAHDSDGSIARVDFLNGNALLARDEVAPFEYSWSGLLAGEYAVSARAVDDAGESVESAEHRFIVAENQLPRVTLLSPTDGQRFLFPDVVTFDADASDPDGAVDRVEYFVNGESIGEAVGLPHARQWSIPAPGSYSVNARAFDQQGAHVDSNPHQFDAIATVPDFGRFSVADGFHPGPLDGQFGWACTGNALLEWDEETEDSYAVLVHGDERASMSRSIVASDGDAVIFIELNLRPTAGPDPTSGTQVKADGVELRFEQQHGMGALFVFDPRSEADAWVPSGFAFPLTDGWISDTPLRVTVRIDRTAAIWDLYLDGSMVRASIPLGVLGPMRVRAASQPAREFAVQILGPAFEHAAATVVSEFYIGWENPIAPDQDFDGIDDAYELQNGMDVAQSDRTADVDSDTLSNIDEYVLGTAAGLADTDGDSLADAWEVRFGLDPKQAASADQDTDNDGVPDVAEAAAGTAPKQTDTDLDGLPDGWELGHGLNPLDPLDAPLDPDGDGISNYNEFRKGTDPEDPLDGQELVIRPLLTASGQLLPGGCFRVRISRTDGQALRNATVTIRIADDANLLTDGVETFEEVTLESDENGIAEIWLTPGDAPSDDDDGGGVA